MTATRSRKEELEYIKHRKNADGKCEFCAINKDSKQFVSEKKYFKVITNIFSYSLWDGQDVADHLMIVPKKHIDSLSELPDAAAIEYVKLISEYESKGYNIYARAPTSVIKSIVHQHTHLIKPAGKPYRYIFLTRKPYIRLKFK